MDEAVQRDRTREIRVGPRRQARPHHRGRRLPRRGSTRATATCASRPTRSARSASAGSGRDSSHGDPWRAFRGNYTQRDVMQEVRQRLAQVPRLPHPRAQHPGLQHRRRQLRHRLRPARARPRAARHATPRSCATRAIADRRHRRPRHDAPPRPPELRVQHRPRAGGRPRRWTPSRSPPRSGSWSAATRRSRASATPRSTRTTTSSSA